MKKRIFTLLLTTALLFCLIPTFPVSAEDSLNDHLIIHYDFEGDTSADALKDKATVGDSLDDLIIRDCSAAVVKNSSTNWGTAKGTFTFADGTVTSVAEGGVFNRGLEASPKADTKAYSNGTGTMIFRIKAGTPSVTVGNDELEIISFRDAAMEKSRPFFMRYYSGSTPWQVAMAPSDNVNTCIWMNTQITPAYDFTASPWLNFAVVTKQETEETGIFTYFYVYVAYGNPKAASDFLYLGRMKAGNGIASAEKIPLTLMGHNGTESYKTADNLTFDDFRYYNIALTTDEIAGVFTDSENTFSGYNKTGIVGWQLSNIYQNGDSGNFYDLRVVAWIDSADMENYTEAGFRLYAMVGDTQTDLSKKVSCCFTKLLARGAGGKQTEYMAPEGKYLIALTVTGIPESVLPDFTMTSYVKTATETQSSKTGTFTVTVNSLIP